MSDPVLIVGGGLEGLRAARLLQRDGMDFQLREARQRLRAESSPRTRRETRHRRSISDRLAGAVHAAERAVAEVKRRLETTRTRIKTIESQR